MLREIYRFGRRQIKSTIKHSIGLFANHVIVLIYHRVTDLATDPQMLAVSPDHFREHLKIIKENYPVLRFEDDWSKVDRPSVVITFDDGYADNYLEALPLLEEAGVPATIFVTTDNLDTDREFWWDELERLILLSGVKKKQFILRDQIYGRSWTTVTVDELIQFCLDICLLMKKVDVGTRENWLNQIREWCENVIPPRLTHRSLRIEELKALASSPLVTIGGHTKSHTALSSQSENVQWKEIIESKKILESVLDQEITVFSYPFGTRKDYTQTTVSLVEKAGYTRVASNFPGRAYSWTNPYQIPRNLVRNWDGPTFVKNFITF